jgi:uncharacterized membrane protein
VVVLVVVGAAVVVVVVVILGKVTIQVVGDTVILYIILGGIGEIIGKGTIYFLLVKNNASGVLLICSGSPITVL